MRPPSNHSRRPLRRFCIPAVAGVLAGMPLGAQAVRQWVGPQGPADYPVSGDQWWTTLANWQGGTPFTDHDILSLAKTYTSVKLNVAPQVEGIEASSNYLTVFSASGLMSLNLGTSGVSLQAGTRVTGKQTGIVASDFSRDVTIQTVVVASGGLSISGTGLVTLSNTPTNANVVGTAGVSLSAGAMLKLSPQSASGSSEFLLGGAGVPVTVSNAGLWLGSSTPLGNAIAVSGTMELLTGNAAVELKGQIQGTGGVLRTTAATAFASAGSLAMTNATNTFGGGMTNAQGMLRLGTQAASLSAGHLVSGVIGTGPLVLRGGMVDSAVAGGTVNLVNALEIAGDVNLGASGTMNYRPADAGGEITLSGLSSVAVGDVSWRSTSVRWVGRVAGAESPGLIKDGYGPLYMTNPGSIPSTPGEILIRSGILGAADAMSLGTSRVLVESVGTLLLGAAASNAVVLYNGATLTGATSSLNVTAVAETLRLSSSSFTGLGDAVFEPVVQGVLSRPAGGTITKDGVGRIRLTANNATPLFDKAWTISGGTLVLGGTHGGSLGTTNAMVVESGGSLGLGGTNVPRVANGITAYNGATIGATNVVSATSTTWINTVLRNSSGVPSIAGVLNTATNVMKDGVGELVIPWSSSGKLYGTLTVSEGVLTLANINALGTTLSGAVVASGAGLKLGVDGVVPRATIVRSGAYLDYNGFSYSAGNTGSTLLSMEDGAWVRNSSTNAVVIPAVKGTANTRLSVTGPVAGEMRLLSNSSHAGGVRVEGGVLLVGATGALGSGSVSVGGGILRLGVAGVAKDIQLDAGGTLDSGRLGFLGNVEVTGAGARLLGAVANPTRATVTGSVHVQSGGGLECASPRVGSLSIDGTMVLADAASEPTGLVGRLDLAGAAGAWLGRLDVNAGALVVDYDVVSPLARLADQVCQGFSPSHDWTGHGIVTSAPLENQMQAVGFAEASDILGVGPGERAAWRDVTADDTSVLVRHTFFGDADLNGIVDLDDLFRLVDGFNGLADPVTWACGDFDYNGTVDLDDLFRLIDGFNASHVAPLPMAVPEPAGLTLLAALAVTLTRRRQRREPNGR